MSVMYVSDVRAVGHTLSRTSFSKFLSAATFTAMHPSFNHSVLTLYSVVGTAEMTTSEIAKHSCNDSWQG